MDFDDLNDFINDLSRFILKGIIQSAFRLIPANELLNARVTYEGPVATIELDIDDDITYGFYLNMN